MSARRFARSAIAIGAVVLASVGAASAGDTKPKAPAPSPPQAPRLVGSWASDPFDSPMGKATQSFCFRGDGTVFVKSETRSGPHSSDGTYKLESGTLTVTWPDGRTVVLTVGWSGEMLTLTDPSGVARVFHRAGNEC